MAGAGAGVTLMERALGSSKPGLRKLRLAAVNDCMGSSMLPRREAVGSSRLRPLPEWKGSRVVSPERLMGPSPPAMTGTARARA